MTRYANEVVLTFDLNFGESVMLRKGLDRLIKELDSEIDNCGSSVLEEETGKFLELFCKQKEEAITLRNKMARYTDNVQISGITSIRKRVIHHLA